jgi:hypothetical protein
VQLRNEAKKCSCFQQSDRRAAHDDGWDYRFFEARPRQSRAPRLSKSKDIADGDSRITKRSQQVYCFQSMLTFRWKRPERR